MGSFRSPSVEWTLSTSIIVCPFSRIICCIFILIFRGTSDKAPCFYFVMHVHLISRLFIVMHMCILLDEVNNTSGEFISHTFTISLMPDYKCLSLLFEHKL